MQHSSSTRSVGETNLADADTATRPGQGAMLTPKVVVSGYYGFGNLGDELILDVILHELLQQGAVVTVLSAQPRETEKTYRQRFHRHTTCIHAIHRNNFVDIVDALGSAHLFVSGGGGLFQDVTGWGSVAYYGGLIRLARFFAVPVAFLGQGFGPVQGRWTKLWAREALLRCQSITVRDEASAQLVEQLSQQKAMVTADPVWLYQLPRQEKLPTHSTLPPNTSTWNVGISLRPWKCFDNETSQHLANVLAHLVRQSEKPVRFLLFSFQNDQDLPVLERFQSQLQQALSVPPPEPTAPQRTVPVFIDIIPQQEVLQNIGHSHILLGMRFHSLVLGLLAHIPVYGLVYDPKSSHLLEQLHLGGLLLEDMPTLTADKLRQYFQQYPQPNLQPLQAKAKMNFDSLEQQFLSPIRQNRL
ncbi:MAG: polysaccharide pyruvyl transferase CsaB [Candidatus Melainabacteria bacterium]|nr:polysaccharide pyruvyl transferase CsaB [Candidatus Melainabacteria bacterium]